MNAERGNRCDNPMRYDVIFRWGSSLPLGQAPKVINRRQAILNSSIKVNMLKLFKHYNVCMPAFYLNTEFSLITKFPVIVRYKSHTQGSGFYVCNNREELMRYNTPDYHALEYIEKVKEYRVFLWKGTVLEVNRKTREDEDGAIPERDKLIRNFKHGWWFKVVKYYDPKIETEAIKALNAVSLDFGAVDLCIDINNNVKIFEINSAPGLIARKADIVANTILESIEDEEE